MCGIVGYIGSREVSSVLVDGLKRLEYRGYDSCGVAIMDEGKPKVIRSVGRIGTFVLMVVPVEIPDNARVPW